MLKKFGIFCLWLGLIFLPLLALYAAEEVILMDDLDEAALFGGGEDSAGNPDMVTDLEETAPAQPNESVLLSSVQPVEWGGSFSFALRTAWAWQQEELTWDYLAAQLTEPDTTTFSPSLGLALQLNARPAQDFRVLGKMEFVYPLSTEPVENLADILQVRELFADYNWADRLFFRTGKHTIKWGVGYYFSPADVLNITPIDPAEPEAEREGPLSVKINFPFGLHNLYLYVLANNVTAPAGIAYAPKLEWVIGNAELGLGAFYRPDLEVRPRGVATATFSLRDLDLFSEAVVSYGSERRFIEEAEAAPAGVEVVRKTASFFIDGTLGCRYSYSNTDSSLNFSLMAQYLYNGDGYADPRILQDHAAALPLLLAARELTPQDLGQRARHYGAASISLADIFATGLTLSAFWIGSSDGSGQVSPSVSWHPDKDFTLLLRVPFTYGETGWEYTPFGTTISPGLTVNLFDHTELSLGVPLLFDKDADDKVVWKSGSLALAMSLRKGNF